MDILKEVRKDLKAAADPKVAATSVNFFKEPIKLYGLKSAAAKAIGKKHFKSIKDKPKKEIFAICEEMWKSGYLEETSMASDWANALKDQFEPADFKVFDRWVNNYVSNWAACDVLCNHTVADFVMMYPEYVKELKKWAKSRNRWAKRASAVTLILPARAGKFLDDVYEIADMLMMDEDDMVQKGYGWMLKAAADYDYKPVFDYIMKHKDKMPRTALRYAIEKMPADVKKKAMAK